MIPPSEPTFNFVGGRVEVVAMAQPATPLLSPPPVISPAPVSEVRAPYSSAGGPSSVSSMLIHPVGARIQYDNANISTLQYIKVNNNIHGLFGQQEKFNMTAFVTQHLRNIDEDNHIVGSNFHQNIAIRLSKHRNQAHFAAGLLEAGRSAAALDNSASKINIGIIQPAEANCQRQQLTYGNAENQKPVVKPRNTCRGIRTPDTCVLRKFKSRLQKQLKRET